jgi:hypothetical protein
MLMGRSIFATLYVCLADFLGATKRKQKYSVVAFKSSVVYWASNSFRVGETQVRDTCAYIDP